jgi:hypothetical protein
MPEYEITRADGTTRTLAADGLGNAVERAGAHPEPVAVRLKTGTRSGGGLLGGGPGPGPGGPAHDPRQPRQPRHAVPLAGVQQVGQCPVPGCDYISSAMGELQAHGLDEHGFAGGVAKHG